MDDDCDPTMLQYSLRHLPTGTLLVATDARAEALQLEAALVATGIPATHLLLQRERVAASHAVPGSAPVPRAAFSKWQ
jgi:hypothetical protein